MTHIDQCVIVIFTQTGCIIMEQNSGLNKNPSSADVDLGAGKKHTQPKCDSSARRIAIDGESHLSDKRHGMQSPDPCERKKSR